MAVERITEVKKITSSNFGELEIQPETIFFFENGILGFDYLKNFVLLTEDETEPFKWLLSIDEPEIVFPILSPWYVIEDYNPGKNFNTDSQVFFSIVTLDDGNGNITVNFKAPILLDIVEQRGEQIILPTEKYSLNHIITTK